MALLSDPPSVMSRWHTVIARCAKMLTETQTLEVAMLTMAQNLTEIFPHMSFAVVLDTAKELLSQSFGASVPSQSVPSQPQPHRHYLFSRPRLDDMVRQDFADRLLKVARRRPADGKRWWLLRECDLNLQDQLETKYQLYGQGLLVMLRFEGEVFGAILLSHPNLFREVKDARVSGSCVLVLAEILGMWLRFNASHLLRSTNQVTEVPKLAALSEVAQLTQPLEAKQDGVLIMEALEALAVTDPLTSPQALWYQICTTLQLVCQADIVVALTADDQQQYHATYAQSGTLVWSQHLPLLVPDFPLTSEQLHADWPDRFIAQVTRDHQPLHLHVANEVQQQANLFAALEQQSLLILPIVVKGQIPAMVVIGRRASGGFSDLMLRVTCTMTAIVAGLFRMQQAEQERDVARSNVEQVWAMTSKITSQAISALSNIVTAHSALLANQPQQVADLAVQIAESMRLSQVEVFNIRIAALLCNIGTIGMPITLLQHNQTLTPSELLIWQTHPHVSVKILQVFEVLKDCFPIIAQHHEQYDGSGYPDQIVGDAIPLGARILAVADAYITLQAEQADRPALTALAAMQHLREYADTLYDANVVYTLDRILALRVAS